MQHYQDTQDIAALATTTDENNAQKARLRRLMYERIAQGHALSEAEDQARDKWRGNV